MRFDHSIHNPLSELRGEVGRWEDGRNQSGEVNPDDPTRVGEAGAGDEAEPFVGKALRDDNLPPSLPLAGLGTLLLVTTAAAGFGLKRLGRRLTRRGEYHPCSP